MAHDVFISYSYKDKPIADAICTNLEVAGVRCWIAPRDMIPGEQGPEAISRAISQSRLMVMVFSADSNTSVDVYRELFLAASNNVVIIPFRIEQVEPEPRKGYILAGAHWLDAMNPPTQEQVDVLVKSVKSFLKKPELPKPVGVIPVIAEPAVFSSHPNLIQRIPAWAWGLLIAALVLAGGAVSFTLWGQTHKAVPLASPILPVVSQSFSPTETPDISSAAATGPLSERARSFAEPILTILAQRKPDYEDDFSKLNGDWILQGSPDSNTYAIEDGVARFWVSQGMGNMINQKAFTGKDFELQFDTRLVSGDVTSWISVDIHTTGPEYGFYTSLYPGKQKWYISTSWGDISYNYASGTDNVLIPGGKFVQVTIIVRGSQYALYLDQIPVSYFKDSNLDNPGETYIHCISISPAECEFDNIKYWNLANIPGLP